VPVAPAANWATPSFVYTGMGRSDRAHRHLSLAIMSVTLAVSACGNGPRSPEECIARWNHPGNREPQALVAEMGFPGAYVTGWPTKAGDHCSATFFTRPDEPWVMFVLWLDAPEPRELFARNIAGSRYGRGQLGAERPIPPKADVDVDGGLNQPLP